MHSRTESPRVFLLSTTHGAETHSLVMRSKSGTVRYVSSTHNFNRKSGFDI